MTRDQALLILENLEVIRHFAAGGEVEFAQHRFDGEFLGWRHCNRAQININCLPNYRIYKPRVRVTEGPRFIPATASPT